MPQRAGAWLLAALAGLGAGGTRAAGAPPASPAPVLSVIPAPAQVVEHGGSFLLRNESPLVVPADSESRRLGVYLAELLHARHGLTLRVRSGGAPSAQPIELRLDPTAPAGEESYRLEIEASGARVTAREHAGLFYGAVTLWQLCSAQPLEGGALSLPAVDITDAPRFRWRGLMLDSARHFQSPEFVMRYIDWLALHKLNVLSWHLTDDQGWRLEIRKYPRLTSVGAWRVPAGRAAQRDIDPATGRPRLYGG
ncbi:MAG TPA: family 20 glycosylhydrolase, partial [Steroidobacteraceae bacterium]|nr:family 20 glycosylhydrolase [Steroidobacteraceae bacterium]